MTDRILNLDAARAARAEAGGDVPVVQFGDREFVLAAELPADFAFLQADGDLRGAIGTLFSAEDVDAFWASRPSIDDLEALADGIGSLYGLSRPESSASDASSSTDGMRSRPTSSGSTDSTSDAKLSAVPESAAS